MSEGKSQDVSPFLIVFGIVIFCLITLPRMFGTPILPAEKARLERIKAAAAQREAEKRNYDPYRSVQR